MLYYGFELISSGKGGFHAKRNFAARRGGGWRRAGFVLRRWELATAFEADTGLPIPGAPATLALIALSVAMAAVLALLCRGKYPSFTGYDEAFQAKGNTLYATAMVLSAFLLLGAAVLMVLSFVQGTNTVYTRLLLAALAAVSFFCVMQTAQNSFKGLDRGKYSFTLLMPAYTCCVWLIAAYQVRAGDPVQLDYVYELFAIIASCWGSTSTPASPLSGAGCSGLGCSPCWGSTSA